MRALVGALAGLIVGTLLVAVISIPLKGNAPWAVLIVGLVAGFLMSKITTADQGSKYLQGGLAAIVTALATIVGPLVATEWFRYQTSTIKPVPVAAAGDVGSEDADAELAVGADAEVAEEPFTTGVNASRSLNLNNPKTGPSNPIEIVCMAIGCLLAYTIGKAESPTTKSNVEIDPEEEAIDTDESPSPAEKDA